MGNLKARLKATFLRRNSSKSSIHDAADEHSDQRSRGSSSRGMNKSPLLHESTSAIPASCSEGGGDDSASITLCGQQEREQEQQQELELEQAGSGTSAKAAPQRRQQTTVVAVGDGETRTWTLDDSVQRPKTPKTPTGATRATRATTSSSSSKNNNNAITDSGNDLQNLPLSSVSVYRPGSSSSLINHSPSPTIGIQIIDSTTTTTTTTTTNATTTGTANTAATATAFPLPSIYEHPATPSTPASIIPQVSVATTPEPLPTNIALEKVHEPANDDPPQSPPLFVAQSTTSSPSRPHLRSSSSSPLRRPPSSQRQQNLSPAHQTTLFKSPLLDGHPNPIQLDAADSVQESSVSTMVTRKIWVKRPMASATLVTINEEDLVDDVREMILRKYANSLGRQFDAPDLTLRICDREQQTSRTLQPDEHMCKLLDALYPNGQAVDDALLIDIPSRRTPKASPSQRFYADDRPHESGNDYFPPYPPPVLSHLAATTSLATPQHNLHFPASTGVMNGNSFQPMPSPGSARRVIANNRPNLQRMHTASPGSTALNSHTITAIGPSTGTHKYSRPVRSRTHSRASSDQSNHPPAAPAIPTPPVAERIDTPPPARVASPRLSNRAKKTKRTIDTPSPASGAQLDTSVPPINILIVEDNMINLRLLEAFVKRLKVRWQTAVNGREAVDKWRAGGFHLVLMDIQLPIMSGLEATREIRRIEKVNSIGVFSSSASSPPDMIMPEPSEEDKLANTELFKSPVIIVALTASSLQSDRHEALAAGCNDFLTKVSWYLYNPII